MDRGESLVDQWILYVNENPCRIVNSRVIIVDASDSSNNWRCFLKLIFLQSQMIDQCHDNRRSTRIVIA